MNLDKQNNENGRRPLIRRGRFRHSFKYEKPALLIWLMVSAAGLVLVLYNGFLVGGQMVAAGTELGRAVEITGTIGEVMIYVVSGVLCVSSFGFAIIGSGGLCSYDAGETEFVVKGPGKKQEIFYYSDVYEVRYEPIKYLFWDRGYLVTITTGVRDVTYRYLYGDGKRNRRIEDSPFYYLEYNCGLCEKDNAPLPDVEELKEMIAIQQYQSSYDKIKEEDDSFFS